jgi:hypothetical protein
MRSRVMKKLPLMRKISTRLIRHLSRRAFPSQRREKRLERQP